MLSHGFVSAALFMVVGVVYDRIHSREIDAYGGLAEVMPVYATVFMLFMLASVGLPGTSGFVGEILVIVGVFQVSSWVAFFAATGMILGAAYMLWLYRRVIFGELLKDTLKGIRDLRTNEVIAFAPLIVLVIVMGVYPSLFLDPMHASVNQLLAQIGHRGHRSRPALSAETRAREPRPDPRRRRADPVRGRAGLAAPGRHPRRAGRCAAADAAGRADHAGGGADRCSRTTRPACSPSTAISCSTATRRSSRC